MTGYHNYSMSNRAVAAYQQGLKPLSRFSAANLKDIGWKHSLAFARWLASKGVWKPAEWHHTSKEYNVAHFYDPQDLIDEWGFLSEDDQTALLKQYHQDRSTKEEERHYYPCHVKWIEWDRRNGRKHAHENEYIGAHVWVRGNTARIKAGDTEFTKRLSTRGFSFEKITQEEMETRLFQKRELEAERKRQEEEKAKRILEKERRKEARIQERRRYAKEMLIKNGICAPEMVDDVVIKGGADTYTKKELRVPDVLNRVLKQYQDAIDRIKESEKRELAIHDNRVALNKATIDPKAPVVYINGLSKSWRRRHKGGFAILFYVEGKYVACQFPSEKLMAALHDTALMEEARSAFAKMLSQPRYENIDRIVVSFSSNVYGVSFREIARWNSRHNMLGSSEGIYFTPKDSSITIPTL